MKKYFIAVPVLLLMFLGCSKDDECECYYSEEFDQYVHHEAANEAMVEQILEDGVIIHVEREILDATAAECRLKGCD